MMEVRLAEENEPGGTRWRGPCGDSWEVGTSGRFRE